MFFLETKHSRGYIIFLYSDTYWVQPLTPDVYFFSSILSMNSSLLTCSLKMYKMKSCRHIFLARIITRKRTVIFLKLNFVKRANHKCCYLFRRQFAMADGLANADWQSEFLFFFVKLIMSLVVNVFIRVVIRRTLTSTSDFSIFLTPA